MEKGIRTAEDPARTAANGRAQVEISYPGKTLPILCMAYKGAAFETGNPDFAAARLLGSLAFGETSELYKKLVIREQKVEFCCGRRSHEPRRAVVYHHCHDKESGRHRFGAKRYSRDHKAEFQTTPVSQQKLADIKRHDKYEFLDGLDSPEQVAEALVRYIALTGGIEAVDKLYAQYDRVTPEDILRAAKQYYQPAAIARSPC